jgi:hypothetical protein
MPSLYRSAKGLDEFGLNSFTLGCLQVVDELGGESLAIIITA